MQIRKSTIVDIPLASHGPVCRVATDLVESTVILYYICFLCECCSISLSAISPSMIFRPSVHLSVTKTSISLSQIYLSKGNKNLRIPVLENHEFLQSKDFLEKPIPTTFQMRSRLSLEINTKRLKVLKVTKEAS